MNEIRVWWFYQTYFSLLSRNICSKSKVHETNPTTRVSNVHFVVVKKNGWLRKCVVGIKRPLLGALQVYLCPELQKEWNRRKSRPKTGIISKNKLSWTLILCLKLKVEAKGECLTEEVFFISELTKSFECKVKQSISIDLRIFHHKKLEKLTSFVSQIFNFFISLFIIFTSSFF